jgi:hypothetical protein
MKLEYRAFNVALALSTAIAFIPLASIAKPPVETIQGTHGPISVFKPFIQGTVTVPAVASLVSELKGITCANLSMSTFDLAAPSPPPPAGTKPPLPNTPRSIGHVPLSGNFASGKCTYTTHVPAGKLFLLSLTPSSGSSCTLAGPNQGGNLEILSSGETLVTFVGPIQMMATQTSTLDMAISGLGCNKPR